MLDEKQVNRHIITSFKISSVIFYSHKEMWLPEQARPTTLLDIYES